MQTTQERLTGYRQGLQAAGLTFRRSLVKSGNSNADRAAEAVHELMSLTQPPTALVVGNNHMTIGVMRALKERRLVVPTDMALAVFDDFDWADVFAPRLTTIAQPIDHIARRSVTMLLERIADYQGPPRTERPAGLWRHRESCGCAPVA